MKTLEHSFLVLFLLSHSIFIYAQDGSLDTTFGDNGVAITDFFGYRDLNLSIIQQSSGKIISAGKIETSFDTHMASLVRFNIDGSIDTSFGNNGLILKDFGNFLNYYLTITSYNNNDLIAGATVGNFGERDFLINKFSPNGEIDSEFGDNGSVTIDFLKDDDTLLNVIILDDEKILAIGRSKQGSNYFVSIARLLSTGELDLTFGINGKLSLDINENSFNSISSSLLDEGSILISFTEYINNDSSAVKVFKFSENGELDPSFGIDGKLEIQFNPATNVRSTFEVDLNNNILIIATSSWGFDEYNTYLYRYLANGDIDPSFGTTGIYYFNDPIFPRKIIVQANSRILVGGGIPDSEGTIFTIKRFYNNGILDDSFVENAYGDFESSDIILQNDGKILAAGNTYWFYGPEDFVLVRFNNDPLGLLDNLSFNITVSPNPSKGIFNINHDFIISETSYQITDITGKIIQTGKLTGEQTEINLSNVQSGMYLITASGSTFRLVKN